MYYNRVSMSKRLLFNLLIIFALLLMFPALWLYNQRLNYRKFLTFDTKFSFNTNAYPKSELSSPTYVLNYMRESGLNASLHFDVITDPAFVMVGRTIISDDAVVEVYEYAEPKDAEKQIKEIKKLGTLEESFFQNLYRYKNLLIYNRNGAEDVRLVLEKLTGAQGMEENDE